MKKLLFGFILLLVAIGIGYIIQKDPGYVLVYYNQWSVSMSLWVAVLTLLLLFLIIYYVLKLIHRLSLLRSNFGYWSSTRKHKKALGHIDQGLCYILNENWAAATNAFNQSMKNSPNPLVNAYFSTIASHHDKNIQQRDDHLKVIMQLSDDYKIPALLLKAHLQIGDQHWHDALNTLDHLLQEAPKHPAVLQKLLFVLQHLEQWDRLKKLLPKIEKFASLDKKSLSAVYENYYYHLLTDNSSEPLTLRWKSIPSAYQKIPRIIRAYTLMLIKHSEAEEALSLIEKTLSKHWDHELITIYGQTPSSETAERLLTAEKWLKNHNNNPDLLLCLGRLCLREKILGKAQEYLIQANSIQPTSQTLLALSELSELTGNQQQAIDYLKDSLTIQ